MRSYGILLVLAASCLICFGSLEAAAAALSIYDIQYTTDPAGDSPQNGNVVDCLGGIVTHKYPGSKPKLTIQNPNNPDGWGAIQIKDWTTGALFDNVAAGDWISLTNVLVEEYRGNTLLRYHSDNDPGFVVESSGNSLPAARVVSLSEIAAPSEGPPTEWCVSDHGAEKYEAMRLTVENLVVSAVDLGKALDNYDLQGAGGSCWASDYMNTEVGGNYYHPYVSLGATFESVTGILEQYTKLSSGWDYYQLLTTNTDDLVVPEPATSCIMLLGGLAAMARSRKARRRQERNVRETGK